MTGAPVGARGAATVITGAAAVSAFGRGTDALLAGALAGTPAFAPVRRFDVTARRVRVAATLPDAPVLADELVGAVGAACEQAGWTATDRARADLLLAIHADPDLPRAAEAERPARGGDAFAAGVATRAGVATAAGTASRAYPSACVAAATAVADGAAAIAAGRAERVVAAAGYLVEPDQYALFDAGRALAVDGRVRPFSADRTGALLGDGVAAVALESAAAARRRGAQPLARLAGWGRAGDAYHACQPRPDGAGMARAIRAALGRGRVAAEEVGYVNAHGSGTRRSDAAEAAALHRALGLAAELVPVSSTKSVHGQALEASGLLELIITVLALRAGRLPVNAGYLGPDPDCPLDVVTEPGRPATEYALSLNMAFGGANVALLVGAA